MLWARNILFLGIVGAGFATLAFEMLPRWRGAAITSYDSKTYRDPEFRAAVAHVDHGFQQHWQSAGVEPTQPAPDLIQARRFSLALMGTVPSLEEIRQFEALPPDQRMPWWIDHVLKDTRCHDYLAERLARSYVGTEDGPFIFYRRRRFVTWIADQVRANRPYDQIVRELIAGEGLWTDHPATNFVTVTVQPERKNEPDPVRLAGRVTRAFLGVRIDCAQCHNHPFAEWKQSDFQSLSAFFGQTHVGFKGIYDGDGEYEAEDKYEKVKKVIEPKVPTAPELLPSQGNRRERLAAWVTHPKNPFFARATVNRMWAILFGRPLVEPIDNIDPSTPTPAALQILADDFSSHGYDLRRLIRLIASSQVFRLDSASDRDIGETEEKAWSIFPLTRLRPEQVAGSVIQAASIQTIDSDSNIVVRLSKMGQQNEFVQRYGDTGQDEFENRGGTIPQRLLLMNGKLVRERVASGPGNASLRIAWLAPNDPKAVEAAYLAVLSRRPTAEEAEHFEKSLQDKSLSRGERLEDLFWALINSTEFSWNH